MGAMSNMTELAQILEDYSNDEPLELIDKKLKDFYGITEMQQRISDIERKQRNRDAAQELLELATINKSLSDKTKDALMEAALHLITEF